MKIRQIIIISISFVFVLYSCTREKKNPELLFKTNKEFESNVNLTFLRPINSQIQLNPLDTTIHFFFQNIKTMRIVEYEISSNSLKVDTNNNYSISDYFFSLFIQSKDSIFSFDNYKYQLILKNKSDEKTKTFQISNEYTPVVTPENLLFFSHNKILLGNSSKSIGFIKKQDRLIYYSKIRPILLLNLNDTGTSCKPVCEFPEKYLKTGDNYYNNFPFACFGKNNNICVSFSADDYLYLYNDSSLVLRKKIKSNFIDEFNPYPDEKQFDMLYMKNYIYEEPKYLSIAYDPWEKVYYRIVKHRNKPKIEEQNEENTWSVIVIDTEMNVIGEKKFNYKYSPNIFIPTPYGIFMARYSDSGNKTIFSLMKIKKNV